MLRPCRPETSSARQSLAALRYARRRQSTSAGEGTSPALSVGLCLSRTVSPVWGMRRPNQVRCAKSKQRGKTASNRTTARTPVSRALYYPRCPDRFFTPLLPLLSNARPGEHVGNELYPADPREQANNPHNAVISDSIGRSHPLDRWACREVTAG
jgi:hypothetical protein